MVTRRELFKYSGVGLAAAALGGWDRARAAGTPVVPNEPLILSSLEGIAVLDFSGAGAFARARGKKKQNLPATASTWINGLLLGQASAGLPHVRKPQAASKFLSNQYKQYLSHASLPRAAGGIGLTLDALSVDAVFAAPGLTLSEPLTLEFGVPGDAGVTYSVPLTEKHIFSGGTGTKVQIDFAAPVDNGAGGIAYGALIRDTSLPTAGILLATASDAALADALDPYGLSNTDAYSATVTAPFTATLTGGSSGVHASGPGAEFSSVYFALSDVGGIAVPQSLADVVLGLLSQFGGF